MVVSAHVGSELERLLGAMTFRERLNFLVNRGIPAVHILGMDSCNDHVGWRPLSSIAPLTFDGTTRWCNKCWRWIQC